MTIHIWSDPRPDQLKDRANGIAQVIHHLSRLLPERGFEYVKDMMAADLYVRHAGAHSSPRVDVEHCHGLLPTAMSTPSGWEWAVNANVTDNLVCAKRITVPSQWVADILRRDMRVNPDVVPWGIDPSEWLPGKDGGYVLWGKGRAQGVSDPTPLMQLALRAQDHRFVTTFGEPSHNVTIVGLVPFERMQVLLREASVYLATTRETFGIQTLEAMACGVPVLGYDWAATRDLVFHKETGFLAQPGNVEELYEGLRYCKANRRRLGEAARELALTYTWAAVADAMAEVYHKALEPHMGPEVSIVIPCYNYGHMVHEAIQSAIEQQGPSHEVIVVDDCSTDNSREVIASFGDSVQALHMDHNVGVAEARNAGAHAARGRYIAFLDADDRIEPGWMSATVTALQSNPRAGISYTKLQLRKPEGTSYMTNWPPSLGDVHALLRCLNSVPTCCLIRREAFDRAGGYRTRFEPTEDGELWTRIAECGYDVVCASNKPLFTYRVGHASLSRGKKLPDYRQWHLPTMLGTPPFAAIHGIRERSFPVRDYDRPIVAVIILHPKDHSKRQLVDTLDMLLGQTVRFWVAGIYGDGPLPDMRAYPFITRVEDPLEELRAPLAFVIDSGDNIFDARSLERALEVWQRTGAPAEMLPREWLLADGMLKPRDTKASLYRRLVSEGICAKDVLEGPVLSQ